MSFVREYKQIAYEFYKWRYEANVAYKLALATLFAFLTALGAKLRIYLPFTPVPITGQTFFVILSAIVLGKYALQSMLIYAFLGAIGMPFFAAEKPAIAFKGFTIVFGATFGYVFGFILAASILGYFIDSSLNARKLAYQISLISFATALIYLCGVSWLIFFAGMSFEEALLKGVLPFIPGDVFKGFAALLISYAILPEQSYNGEIELKSEKNAGRIRKAGIAIAFVSALSILLLFFFEISSITSEKAGFLLISKLALAYALPVALLSFSLIKLLRMR